MPWPCQVKNDVRFRTIFRGDKMPTACDCGATKCLECVLDCPGCHDSIEDHIEEKKEGVSCQI